MIKQLFFLTLLSDISQWIGSDGVGVQVPAGLFITKGNSYHREGG